MFDPLTAGFDSGCSSRPRSARSQAVSNPTRRSARSTALSHWSAVRVGPSPGLPSSAARSHHLGAFDGGDVGDDG